MKAHRIALTLALVSVFGALAACSSGGNPQPQVQSSPPPPSGSIEVILERAPGSSLQLFSIVARVVGGSAVRATDDRFSQHLIEGVAPGDQVVEASDPTPNCQIEGDDQKPVAVSDGETATVSFSVSCTFTPVSRIAFSGDLEDRGFSTIWTVRPDGTELQELNRGIWPQWSPDGTRIMYLDPGSGNWVVNFDGTESRVFSPGAGWQATWSPDSSQLVVRGGSTLPPDVPLEEGSGQPDLWRVSFDGSDVQRITDDEASETNPAWSPDGSMIAIVKDNDFQLIDTNGSFLLSLGQGLDGSWPRWSPDGSKLVFAWNAPGEEPEFQIWTVNVDGSNRTQLTTMDTPCGGQTFSPDGTEIIFHCDELMWRMNADGTNQSIFAEMPGPGVLNGADWIGP